MPRPSSRPSAHSPPSASRWRHTCGQGLTGLNLDEGGGAVSAVFSCGPVESNPGLSNGSYPMAVRVDLRSLTLIPKAWIERTPGYVMVGLVAELPGDDPDVLFGT